MDSAAMTNAWKALFETGRIARAALRDAPILLLDEPTSQVDLAGEAAILRSLARLAQGRTVFMIAHRPGAILAADRVIELAGVEA